ncbi:MAG: uncharacterized protein QOF51_309 [Chloroflexota bacterium]|nr:uncharacterized protein [Chloroflexota bacterium]
MTGTLINVGTVLAGGTLGSLIGGRFPGILRTTLMQVIGLATIVIGLQRVLPVQDVLVLLVSLVLGTALGEALHLERGLERLGELAQARFGGLQSVTPEQKAPVTMGPPGPGGDRSNYVARGFITASLLFCVGPLTILGSFEDGLTGAYETLALKSALDGVAAVLLASALGWGVLLAAGTVLLYQGGLTLGAGVLRGVLTDPMIALMTAVGGLMILGLGLNILELTRIRVASMLPALVVAPLLVALLRAWDSIHLGGGG